MLILLRHGQTEANARGLLLGRSDPSLTELGRAQARLSGSALPAGAAAVCSPLSRARETAQLALPGSNPRVDERWIEVDYGAWEGLTFAELPSEEAMKWRFDPTYQPPGGESLADVGQRVREALSDIAEDATDGDVVVVSHVSPIKAAIAWALDTGDEIAWRLSLSVAAITRIAVGRGMGTLTSFNETAHLLDR